MNTLEKNQIIAVHIKQKRAAEDFKERRFIQWNENYAMFRDKIELNVLTQRNASNIPVIRESMKSWISNIDEPPEMSFKNRDKGNKNRDKEIVVSGLWDKFYDDNKLDTLDQLDKKNVGMQGRSFKHVGWDSDKKFVFCDLVDSYDILLPRNTDPLDLNKSEFLKHINIFADLNEILQNEDYNKEERNQLKMYYAERQGLVKAPNEDESYERSRDRLRLLGDSTDDDEYNFIGTKVELNKSYDLVWDQKLKKRIRRLRVFAADRFLLLDVSLEKAIGIDKLPIVSWASDPDAIDVWSDGLADNLRPLNKIINIYFSQDIENRGYRNFGMFFFNNMKGQFTPRGFQPRPFGFYGLPGNPRDMVQQVEIQPLGDTSNQIEYLKTLAQGSVAQTATERGQDSGADTLGEIKLNLEQSTSMNNVDMKHYRRAWEEVAELFLLILEEHQTDLVVLEKEGGDGEYREKKVGREDWINKKGYKCVPKFKKEQQQEDNFEIQKTQYIMNGFQNNPVALKIAKTKQLEAIGWNSEEVEQAMQAEDAITGMNTQQPLQDESVDQQASRGEGAEGLQNQPKNQI
ncbi:MAG: hypothetical protein ACTSQE_12590 [Candidatus Heimdallarchaeaceae archaeon]